MMFDLLAIVAGAFVGICIVNATNSTGLMRVYILGGAVAAAYLLWDNVIRDS